MERQEYTVNKDNKKVQTEVATKALAGSMIEILMEERKRQGITQREIADITGMKAPNITRIESKKYTPTLEVLLRYAKALGKEFRFELVDEDK